jgi:DNA polymerase-3 subunit alpha
MRLEGVSRHSSTHAAGIVISKDPLLDLVPLQRPDPDTGFSIAQWGMDDIADVGLLKIDYLGLTNLTILGKALEIIESTSGETIDLLRIPDKDLATAEMMSQGHTFGVFQMEGSGMTEASRLLEPSGISDMAALVALYRPGPMEHIPRFAEVKKGLKEPQYLDPALEPILAETYGVITYQEQVLQIAQKFAGYSLGQADVMRKAMGKKIAEVMTEERERFVSGIESKGHKRRLGEKLFDLIEPFAGYAFNKAHAVCYGLIAYQTAYLKAHYPIEYMSAVLCSSSGDRTALAAAECQRLGISISLPDINRSRVNFNVEVSESIDGARSIRYGLGQVKDVGSGSAELIVAERVENGEYSSMEDFAARLPSKSANRRIIEALARAGSFDSLCDRGIVLQNIERIIDISKEQKRLRDTGQTTMFDLLGSDGLGGLDMSDPMLLPSRQIQLWEREYLGTYISDHPLTEASLILDKYVTHSPAELTSFLDGKEAIVAGIITDVRELTARVSNRPFCAIRVEGFTGSSEIMIWNKEYEHYFKTGILAEGNIVLAKVSIRTNKNSRTTVAAKFVVAYDPHLKNIGPNFNEAQFQIRRQGGGVNNVLNIKDRPRAKKSQTEYLNVKSFPADSLASRETKVKELRRDIFETSTTLDNGLLIRIDETRDASADRRRIHHLFQILDESPGSYTVTLEIEDRNHLRSQVRRAGIDERMISDIASRLRETLGVLGSVEYEEVFISDVKSRIIDAEPLKIAGGN